MLALRAINKIYVHSINTSNIMRKIIHKYNYSSSPAGKLDSFNEIGTYADSISVDSFIQVDSQFLR